MRGGVQVKCCWGVAVGAVANLVTDMEGGDYFYQSCPMCAMAVSCSLLEGEQGWARIHRFCEYHGEEGERYLGRGSLRVCLEGPEAL